MIKKKMETKFKLLTKNFGGDGTLLVIFAKLAVSNTFSIVIITTNPLSQQQINALNIIIYYS